MGLLKRIIKWLGRDEKIMYWRIHADYFDNLVYRRMRNKDVQIIPLNAKLRVPLDETELSRLVQRWLRRYKRYIPEVYDCDDYAFCFKCFASYNYNINGIGVVLDYGMGHAYNITVLPFVNIQIIEPQTGRYMSYPLALHEGYMKCPCIILV